MQVREDYASVGDFVKILVFEAAVHMKGAEHATLGQQTQSAAAATLRCVSVSVGTMSLLPLIERRARPPLKTALRLSCRMQMARSMQWTLSRARMVTARCGASM
jgi:hypothetical protein